MKETNEPIEIESKNELEEDKPQDIVEKEVTEPKLTPKQRKFAEEYLETGNASEAVRRAGYDVKSDTVAATIGSENIRKPNIMEFLQSKAEVCANNIYILANSAENENVRLNANKDILDRSGFKPTDRVDHTTNGESINPDSSERVKELTTKLNAIYGGGGQPSDGSTTSTMGD